MLMAQPLTSSQRAVILLAKNAMATPARPHVNMHKRAIKQNQPHWPPKVNGKAAKNSTGHRKANLEFSKNTIFGISREPRRNSFFNRYSEPNHSRNLNVHDRKWLFDTGEQKFCSGNSLMTKTIRFKKLRQLQRHAYDQDDRFRSQRIMFGHYAVAPPPTCPRRLDGDN